MNLRSLIGIINSFIGSVNIVGIENIMEEFVLKQLDKMMNSDNNICKCEKYRMSVARLALNNLKTHYVSTDKGTIYTSSSLYEKNNELDIMCAFGRRIKFVGDNPQYVGQ